MSFRYLPRCYGMLVLVSTAALISVAKAMPFTPSHRFRSSLAPSGKHVLHSDGLQLPASEWAEDNRGLRIRYGSGKCAQGVPHEAGIYVSYDSTFCNRNGGRYETAEQAIIRAFEIVDDGYEGTCVFFTLWHFDGYCDEDNDPFAGWKGFSDGLDILRGFKKYWMNNFGPDVPDDMAILLTGYEDRTTALGWAAANGACSLNGFAWVEFPSSHNEDQFRRDVYSLAHEIGHLLGAPHDSEGIMADTSPSSRSWDTSYYMSDNSIQAIADFVDMRSGPRCLPEITNFDEWLAGN